MVKPSRDAMLQYWKKAVSRKPSSIDYNLTEDSEWVKIPATLEIKITELENATSESEIREVLRHIFLPSSKLIWASIPRIFFGFLKNADLSFLIVLKNILLNVNESDAYQESWVEDIYDLLMEINPEGTKKYLAAKSILKNVIGELFGKLHSESFPIKNSCSRKILKFMGYSFDEKDYESFNEAYKQFKHDYLDTIDKMSSDTFPINIEIDQFFNYFDKDDDARIFLKTGVPPMEEFPESALIIRAIQILSDEGKHTIPKEELMRKIASLTEADGSYLSGDWENKTWEIIKGLASSHEM